MTVSLMSGVSFVTGFTSAKAEENITPIIINQVVDEDKSDGDVVVYKDVDADGNEVTSIEEANEEYVGSGDAYRYIANTEANKNEEEEKYAESGFNSTSSTVSKSSYKSAKECRRCVCLGTLVSKGFQ